MKLLMCLILGLAGLGCDEGKSLQDWKPSTKIPQEAVNAARFLFDHGLADPIGGTYREATIEVSEIWRGQKRQIKVNAFQIGNSKRVVAWNGLAYDALALGKQVDLAQDVRAKLLKGDPVADFGYRGNAEATFAASANHIAGAFLLLRHGRSDLAEEVYKSLGKAVTVGYSGQSGDAWFRPAIQYLSYRYDRALAAHMQGDDKVALEDFKVLSENYQAFWDEADRRLSPEFKRNINEPGFSHPIAFIAPVTGLFEDSKIRNSRPSPLMDIKSLNARPQAERIARLVEGMSQINERQWGQPGSVSVSSSDIIKALVAEGDEAVDPLLDCMETDKRFTRSVSFGRDFHINRNPITVAACARVALNSILGVNTSGNPGPYWSAEQVRKYWEANKGTTIQERWYRDLQNDSADYEAWELAARNITERSDIVRNGNWVTIPKRTPGRMLPPVKGESLRIGKSPSVTVLLHRRAVDLMGSGKVGSSRDIWKGQSGADIAIASYKWDPKASLPTLQAITQGISKLTDAKNQGHHIATLLARAAKVYSARAALGDSKAIVEYAALLDKLTPATDYDLVREAGILQVLWEQYDHPEVKSLAGKLFLDAGSPWNLFEWIQAGETSSVSGLVDEPILLVPEFRAALAKAIFADIAWGSGVFESRNGSLSFRYKGQKGMQGSFGIQRQVPKDVIGDNIPISAGDFLILSMYRIKGLPEFQIYWSEKRKAESRKRIANYFTSQADFSPLISDSSWYRYRID